MTNGRSVNDIFRFIRNSNEIMPKTMRNYRSHCSERDIENRYSFNDDKLDEYDLDRLMTHGKLNGICL